MTPAPSRDFFQAQARARRNTLILIVLCALAIAGMTLTFYGVARLLIDFQQTGTRRAALSRTYRPSPYLADSYQPGYLQKVIARPWDLPLLEKVTAAILLLIALGAAYKMSALSEGPRVIVEQLGGRQIQPNTHDPYERRVANVVEEMAIAAGIPVPALYLLPKEEGINALASGFDHRDAVVAVTNGAMTLLTREELQAVVGHEFSHLLNGDSRLKLRLIGLVHGILAIALVGYAVLRAAWELRPRGRSRIKLDLGGVVLVILLVAVALWLVGSIGVFFSRLLKAAVCRERERLADASGVQFTRNPLALAGALKKIAAHDQGSRIESHRAEEASHLFFSGVRWHLFEGLFASHPSLESRIKLLDPSYDEGEVARIEIGPIPIAEDDEQPLSGLAAAQAPITSSPIACANDASECAEAWISRTGKLAEQDVAYAQRLLQKIPAGLRLKVREPQVSQAVVFGLVLDAKAEVRDHQLQALRATIDPSLWASTQQTIAEVARLGPEVRLPLLDLALPALRSLSREQANRFQTSLRSLWVSDHRLGVFEFLLQQLLLRRLQSGPLPSTVLGAPTDQASLLLSMVAHLGQADPAQAQPAFQSGAQRLATRLRGLRFLSRSECSYQALSSALVRLGETSPSLKRELLLATLTIAFFDGTVTESEAEIFRAISDALGCPVPPLLPREVPELRKAG